jgi:hypothetical protein
VAGDVADSPALVEEFMDEGVVGAGSLGEPAGRILLCVVLVGSCCDGCLPLRLGFWAGRWNVVQAGAVGSDGLLDCGGQVLPEVEAVGDLEGLGCGGVGRLGVGARTVAADDLDFGMGREPWGEGGGVALGQQVQDLVGLGSITTVP